MANLREIGMDGGREGDRGGDKNEKKNRSERMGNTSANRMKRVACLSARRSGKRLSEEEK